ncbi:dnaJ homolog subfamily C member 7-like [Cynara cardunculus var. scolymus]|uniref:dnaJ homolog subfamily C member 7-like n=1 Tax=Cynara cardunculus var. scolymus TaxID=59895 RepID=UPI000D62C260|nr:dnaJ homolog subfamily C member 7-like [Cynara cardunculus var. scolymus]
MARVHPGNMNSRVPDDYRTTSDHLDDQPRNHDFEKKARDAATPRGGGRAGVGRGGGRSEYIKCCYGCGEPGHIVRDCPTAGSSARSYGRRGSQASGNDPSKVGVLEITSGTAKFRTKPLITSTEISTNSEPVKPFLDELSSKNVDTSPLLAKIEQKENELILRGQEIEGLNRQLMEVTTELRCTRVKNEEMILNVSKLQKDLEKYRQDLSSARNKEAEMSRKCWHMKNEFEETKDELYEKITELEECKDRMYEKITELEETNDAEMMKLKLETEQWRKAAKAIASVLGGGAEVCSKTPELESLVLYYSNRAAKRMSLGKMRKAVNDCRMATLLDPSFLRVCLTAGNCHLALGEMDGALYNYKKCLESGVICLDRRLAIEASDGLQNAEKVVNYVNQSAELLEQKTLESATKALEVITEALSISCYSEKLLEMKGEALFMLRKYEEVVQMCEQTLAFAEKNYATISDSNHTSNEEEQKRLLKLWRWNLMSRSYFHMARFDKALAILEKHEKLAPAETKTEAPSALSAATVSELLRLKSAGNEAYQAGRHREAVRHYSNALLRSVECRPFAAICLGNRAAAHQALGEVVDAIADCNLAIALDDNYLKAISRRANLHEKIRDYEHAALDLQRLISLLEKQCEAKYVEELRIARQRLSSINRYMKKEMTLDLYLILGLKGSESGAEIKKAYHKAALRHHPDKAGKFLVRSESGADSHVWNEIFTTIHEDADKLFKIIGEAYAVLSDANKRFKYNLEDAMKDDFGW